MIKCLCIQIILANAPDFDQQDLLDVLNERGRYPEIDADEQGTWISFNLFTENLAALWDELKAHVLPAPALAELFRTAAIVVAEGDDGWRENLVLHHHDPDVEIDSLT